MGRSLVLVDTFNSYVISWLLLLFSLSFPLFSDYHPRRRALWDLHPILLFFFFSSLFYILPSCCVTQPEGKKSCVRMCSSLTMYDSPPGLCHDDDNDDYDKVYPQRNLTRNFGPSIAYVFAPIRANSPIFSKFDQISRQPRL